jgi:hypothetical protein
MSLPSTPFQVVSFAPGCSQSPYLIVYVSTNQCSTSTCQPWSPSPYYGTYDCPSSISQELLSKFGTTSYVTFQLYGNSSTCQTQSFQYGIAIATATTSCIDLDELQLSFANIHSPTQTVKSMKLTVNQNGDQYSNSWYTDTSCSVQVWSVQNDGVGTCNVNFVVQPYLANSASSTTSTQTIQGSASVNGTIQKNSEVQHMTSLFVILCVLSWVL